MSGRPGRPPIGHPFHLNLGGDLRGRLEQAQQPGEALADTVRRMLERGLDAAAPGAMVVLAVEDWGDTVSLACAHCGHKFLEDAACKVDDLVIALLRHVCGAAVADGA